SAGSGLSAVAAGGAGDGATATAGGVVPVDPVISLGIVTLLAPGEAGGGAVAPALGSRGVSGASAAGMLFVLGSVALVSERRSGAGGTNEGAGAGVGAGAIEGARAGGASRVLLVSLGAWREPRELLTSWNVPSTSSSTPMPIISGRRPLEIAPPTALISDARGCSSAARAPSDEASAAAAWAARRAAAMKFALPLGSPAGRGGSSASEAAIRSAGVDGRPRGAPVPGSSGWSAGSPALRE